MEALFSRLARRAAEAKTLTLSLTALCAALILCIPILFSFLHARPSALYERLLGVELDSLPKQGLTEYLRLSEGGDGFVSAAAVIARADLPGAVRLLVSEEQGAADLPESGTVLFLNSETVLFRHGALWLEAPISAMPAWAVREGDYREIIDRLALLNGYYGTFYLPAALLVCLGSLLSLASLGGMLAGLLGLGRKMTHALSFGKRVKVLLAVSWLCALPCTLLGFWMPVMHLVLFAFAATLMAWQVQKRL